MGLFNIHLMGMSWINTSLKFMQSLLCNKKDIYSKETKIIN